MGNKDARRPEKKKPKQKKTDNTGCASPAFHLGSALQANSSVKSLEARRFSAAPVAVYRTTINLLTTNG